MLDFSDDESLWEPLKSNFSPCARFLYAPIRPDEIHRHAAGRCRRCQVYTKRRGSDLQLFVHQSIWPPVDMIRRLNSRPCSYYYYYRHYYYCDIIFGARDGLLCEWMRACVRARVGIRQLFTSDTESSVNNAAWSQENDSSGVELWILTVLWICECIRISFMRNINHLNLCGKQVCEVSFVLIIDSLLDFYYRKWK
jgi:hypothetical protein